MDREIFFLIHDTYDTNLFDGCDAGELVQESG